MRHVCKFITMDMSLGYGQCVCCVLFIELAPCPHLRNATVVLARLCNVHAVVLQVIIQNDLADTVVFNVAFYNSFFEIPEKSQYLRGCECLA